MIARLRCFLRRYHQVAVDGQRMFCGRCGKTLRTAFTRAELRVLERDAGRHRARTKKGRRPRMRGRTVIG